MQMLLALRVVRRASMVAAMSPHGGRADLRDRVPLSGARGTRLFLKATPVLTRSDIGTCDLDPFGSTSPKSIDTPPDDLARRLWRKQANRAR
jgi:hypothetical protein